MLFAESSSNVGGALLLLALVTFGISRTAKAIKGAASTFDKDGAVKSAIKDGIVGKIGKWFGK